MLMWLVIHSTDSYGLLAFQELSRQLEDDESNGKKKTTAETLILIAIKLMGKKQPNIQYVSVFKN